MIDLDILKEEIEKETQLKVGLHYKAIYRGKISMEKEDKTITRVIHVELEIESFNKNFKYFYLSMVNL